MFVTNVTPNAPIAGAIDDEGYRIWPHTTLATELPFYMVEYRYLVTLDFTIPRSVFLSNTVQLIELKNDPKVTIINAYLLSPDSLNNQNQWLLEPLLNIKKGYIGDTEEPAIIYNLENGNQYIDAILEIDEKSIKNVEVMLSK